MRVRLFWLALGLLVVLAPWAGASTTAPGRQVWDNDEDSPTAVTESVKCKVVEVLPERVLVVEDEQGRRHSVTIPEKAKIRAQSKKDFDGKRDLEFGQLREGLQLKITFLAENGSIVRVQVLKQG